MPAVPTKVIVHPLVLLSAVDHFNRIATKKRVVGILLGEVRKGIIDVTNSYAGANLCLLLSD
jgi:26S proteasome regulatory subunit N8